MASAIRSLPWVADEINEHEQEVVQRLVHFATFFDLAFGSLMDKSWVHDSLNESESAAVEDLYWIADDDPAIALRILDMPWVIDEVDDLEAGAINWVNNFKDANVALSVVALGWVQDGIGEIEVKTIEELSYITYDNVGVASSVVALDWVQDGIEAAEVEAIDWLNNFDDAEAESVVALGWVQDGIEELEVKAIRELSYIAYYDAGLATLVVDLSWVQDGITGVEAEAIDWFSGFNDAEVALSVVALEWVQQGIGEQEARALEELSYLSRKNEGQASRIVDMPFLETLEPPDVSALESLVDMAWFRQADYQRVLSHSTLSDGITDDWAKIVATLYGVSKNNSPLLDKLLDPDQVILEERTIDLPLTGKTHLAIIRTAHGAERSMDLLEHAIHAVEAYMAVPLPTNYVGLLFEEAVSGDSAGTNFGTHVAALPKYDVDDGSHEAEFAGSLIAHEVAHYYWTDNRGWVDEGVADLMGSLSEKARAGQPIEVTNDPCAYARTIAELETLDPAIGESEYTCNYALGERLFIDLYRSMDEDSFRRGLRDLYLLSQVADEDEMQDDTEVGIDHVKAAFKSGEDSDNAVVDVIAARWYDGTEPYDTSALETGPADSTLLSIDGRIDRAYLAAVYEGPPTTSFSAQAADDWVQLFLHFSYAVGSDTEVRLEIVEYFEDGFELRRRSRSFTAQSGYIGQSLWYGVGLAPSERWAIGHYWVHVYNEGRKLVELEYEVTP